MFGSNRRSVAAALSAALLLLAAAAGSPFDGFQLDASDEGELEVGGRAGHDGTTGTPEVTPVDTGPTVPYEQITLRSIGTDNGQPCIVVTTEWVPADDATHLQNDNSTAFFTQYDRLTRTGTTLMPCPAPTPGIDPTPALDFADEIVLQLPRPALQLDPGFNAITGNTAYLQTGRPLTYGPVTRRLDLGPWFADVTVTATGSFTVAWGDHPAGPSVTDGTTYTWAGSPYPGTGPDGAVDHTWTDTGTYTLTVTDTWQLTIDVDGWGTLTDTATLTPVTATITVDEVRAVRDR